MQRALSNQQEETLQNEISKRVKRFEINYYCLATCFKMNRILLSLGKIDIMVINRSHKLNNQLFNSSKFAAFYSLSFSDIFYCRLKIL